MNQLPTASSLQPQASLHIPCRHCGGSLHRSASGLLCMDCRSRIIPAGEISDHYEAYSDREVAQLPENTCNDAEEIGKIFSRFRSLDSDNLSDKQRQRLERQQDKAFKRMTYQRLKIENENLKQRRLLFDGERPQEIEVQHTLF